MMSEKQRVQILCVILEIEYQQLAELLGVTRQTVYTWTMGKRGLSPTVRKRLNALCEKEGIAFLPSGMPVKLEDYALMLQPTPEETRNARKSSSSAVV